MGERCQDLCRERNPCLGNLQCLVTEDYDGKRNVACACPEGMVAVSDSRCEPSKFLTVPTSISLREALTLTVLTMK